LKHIGGIEAALQTPVQAQAHREPQAIAVGSEQLPYRSTIARRHPSEDISPVVAVSRPLKPHKDHNCGRSRRVHQEKRKKVDALRHGSANNLL
jgi:hypothetical protein